MPNKKRVGWGYVMLPLEREVVEAIDDAAWRLGITRTNLVRILVLTYYALLQLQHPAVALFTAAQEASKALAGGGSEQGGAEAPRSK